MFKHLSAVEGLSTSPAQFIASPVNAKILAIPKVTTLSSSDVCLDEKIHQDALQAFFAFFNPWCCWVDEGRFRADMGVTITATSSIVRQNLYTAYYSPLLHFAILAIGVMYLDKTNYPNRDLISDALARNAITSFEEEIEMAKLSAVVGLVLLGTHHAGHARQSLGYIYSGSGLRLTRIREHHHLLLFSSSPNLEGGKREYMC